MLQHVWTTYSFLKGRHVKGIYIACLVIHEVTPIKTFTTSHCYSSRIWINIQHRIFKVIPRPVTDILSKEITIFKFIPMLQIRFFIPKALWYITSVYRCRSRWFGDNNFFCGKSRNHMIWINLRWRIG